MLKQLQDKFSQFLWQTELVEINSLHAYLIKVSRIFYGAIRDLSGGLPSLRAMSLVYTTLLSIVPLLAVSFSVLKGFGAHNQLEPALLNMLQPLGEKGAQLSQQIISFVDNMRVGVLGSVGLLFLILTVLSLVKKIESAFNHTWHISVTRNIFQRFSNYLSVILIGPLLLFTGAGITASFNSHALTARLLSIEPFGMIILFLGELMPYLLTIITFTLIYILIPNTKVRIKSALFAAVITTILWKAAGSLFTAFIVNSTSYTAIYSGFAILVIFMIWIYINWLIVLTGASIAYYHQNPERIPDKSQVVRLSCRLREKLALTIMQLIACSFHNKSKETWTIASLAKKTHISETAIQLILSTLESNELITTTGENKQNYLLAQASENISIASIISVARRAEETTCLHPDDVDTVAQVNDIIFVLERAISESCENKMLKDLL